MDFLIQIVITFIIVMFSLRIYSIYLSKELEELENRIVKKIKLHYKVAK